MQLETGAFLRYTINAGQEGMQLVYLSLQQKASTQVMLCGPKAN